MQLVILRGLAEHAFPLAIGEGIIGRAPGSTVELHDPEVSRQHCRFIWDGHTLTIDDLASARGTSVNGTRISVPTVVHPGDEIVIGPVVLTPQVGENAPPPIVAPALPVPAAAASMLMHGEPANRIELSGEITLGRDSSCEVVLNDASISRKHAKLHPLPNGGCAVTDLQSAGGSFINGQRFDEHEFTVGDRLQVGPFFFQFDGLALVRVNNSSGGSIRATGVFMHVTEQSLIARLQGKSRTNTILENVSVHVQPSRFYGLIGPSGAGKSSLLNTLAGLRKPEGGFVMVDGDDVYANDEPPAFGFVPQDDIVHLDLTVRQALRFAAKLRLAAATPKHEIDRLLDQTMEQLGLSQRADFPIARLSGGQRKRVSVAVELLAKPSILFLDEPTSGLDPATEFKLMSLLRDLADTGCTIVCTTHVMENAYLIDQLVILVAGCLAFQGSADEVRDYFHVAKLTDLYDELAERPAKEWQTAYEERINDATIDPPAPPPPKAAADARPLRAFALPILLARQCAIYLADWRNFLLLFGQPLIIAGLVSWVTDERELIVFFAYLSTLYFGCSNASQEIVKEIAIYRRERLVGVGAHSYLASKFIFLTALTMVQAATIHLAMLLFEGGRDGDLLMQFAALFGTALAAVGIGCSISALAPSVMQAVTIVPVVLIPMIIFSGYVVKPTSMRKSVRALSRCTPGYAAQVVMDTSFIYNRPLVGEINEDHYQAIKNLGANDPDNRTTDDRYVKLSQATIASMVHAIWAIATYWLAWFALRKRERN